MGISQRKRLEMATCLRFIYHPRLDKGKGTWGFWRREPDMGG